MANDGEDRRKNNTEENRKKKRYKYNSAEKRQQIKNTFRVTALLEASKIDKTISCLGLICGILNGIRL